MFQRILVALDGSARAESALPVAVRLVNASGGILILVRAVATATEYWPAVVSHQSLEDTVLDADFAEARRYMAGVLTRLQEQNVPCDVLVERGPVVSTILSAVHLFKADSIVMCSHGYSGMKRWVMGSMTEQVARHASVPVLILREGGTLLLGRHLDDVGPLQVLVPLDGSVYARSALIPTVQLITALAVSGKVRLHLARVVKPLRREEREANPLRDEIYGVQRAKKYLSKMKEHLCAGLIVPGFESQQIAVTWSVIIDDDIAHGIIRVAEDGDDTEGAGVFGGCDLIAIATHGRDAFQRLALGSVTERILRETKLPLLVVQSPTILSKQGEQPVTSDTVMV